MKEPRVTNPDKLMFPDDGLTKADLVGYYATVSGVMVPHLTRRPLTVKRFPNGIGESGFMQKNAADYFPDSIDRFDVAKREGGATTYPIVDDADGLLYLANLAAIEFHIWNARVPDIDRPDRLVLDLDPPERDYDAARAAARAVRDVMGELGIEVATPMTTGSNGYHVVAPLLPALEIDDVSKLSRIVAELTVRRDPDAFTTEFRIDKREGRVFIDWLRNRFAQTGIAPWSLRAKPKAPVATPIEWDELDATDPRRWTLRTIEERLQRDVPDPLAEATTRPNDPEPALIAAESAAAAEGIELTTFDRFRG